MSEYKDCIGREISVGDYILHNGVVYEVKKLTTKMLSCYPVKPPSYKKKNTNMYSWECALLPAEEVLLWVIATGA